MGRNLRQNITNRLIYSTGENKKLHKPWVYTMLNPVQNILSLELSVKW